MRTSGSKSDRVRLPAIGQKVNPEEIKGRVELPAKYLIPKHLMIK